MIDRSKSRHLDRDSAALSPLAPTSNPTTTGPILPQPSQSTLYSSYPSDRNEEERASAVVNILKANAGEASMMARCAGKTRLHNVELEDLRSVTRATAAATGIPLTGTRAA